MAWEPPKDPLIELGPKIGLHVPGWEYFGDKNKEYGTYNHYLIPKGTKFKWGSRAIHMNVNMNGTPGRPLKVHVSGMWPRSEQTGATYYPSLVYEEGEPLTCEGIGISITKDPKVIACDIIRRLLPVYETVYSKCECWMRKAEGAQTLQYKVAEEVAKLTKGHISEQNAAHVSFSNSDDMYGHVTVNVGGNTATCELRGSVELIQAALTAIKHTFKK